MIVDFFLSVLGVVVGIGLMNAVMAVLGSSMRFGWYQK